MQKFMGETALWRGRSARKIIQWMIFSEGRAAAPGKERFSLSAASIGASPLHAEIARFG